MEGKLKACRDPDDDMFLECAMRAKADILVAGDKDLLVLGRFEGIRIVTPAEYPRNNLKRSRPSQSGS
ncbi:MAG TPA: putative toxin-antitoxin system toxin component, PIN family [Acidisarcina sp.]